MRKSSDNSWEEEVNEVNVTPLADVTLVLLIVIMVISPVALQSMIQVQTAQAVSGKVDRHHAEKPLFVDVTAQGFMLNNAPISTEYALFRTLQRELSDKVDKTVLISSAADVRYDEVVRVMDLVKQSGATSLSLVPRKKKASS